MDVSALIIAVFHAVQAWSEDHQPPRHRVTKPKPSASGALTIGIAADISGLDAMGRLLLLPTDPRRAVPGL